jgi:hypothetical protein
MVAKCLPCNKEFRTEQSLDQHVRSQGHATRQLAIQRDIERRLASQSLTSSTTQNPLTIAQSQPSHVSQTQPQGSRTYCEPCKRSFKSEPALLQHLRDTKTHKIPVLPTARVQAVQVQILRNQTVPTQTAPRVSSTAATTAAAPPPPPQRQRQQQQARISTANARASSSRTLNSRASSSRTLNYATNNPVKPKKAWSVVPPSEHMSLWEGLLSSCHPNQDLVKNKYCLSPYTEEALIGLRKCKKCGRKFGEPPYCQIALADLSYIGLAKHERSAVCSFHPGKLVTTVRCCSLSSAVAMKLIMSSF